MKRRDFLKKSSLAVSAVAVAALTGSSFRDIYANEKKRPRSFSFEIITDNPGKALIYSENFFRNNKFDYSVIKYSEFKADGEMFGDIVFIKDGSLINYKEGSGKINNDLRSIAESLSLPKKITNPSRLRFSMSEKNSEAEKFLVFHKNILVKTISADEKSADLYLKGTKGNLLLKIENKRARVVSSDCMHKTCVNTGSISHSGESIVCIPNELLILCE